MRDPIDNGGNAFPLFDAKQNYTEWGMSLRDWFAGQALSGIMANSIVGDHHRPANAVKEAFELADLMIAEKRKTEGNAQ